MQTSFSDQAWFDHLGDDDWELIRRVAPQAGVDPARVRGDVDALTGVLAHPAAFEAVFGGADDDAVLAISPFLAFALIVHRAWDELQHVGHVDEWVGPRQRLPVLGGVDLREFLGAAPRRLFLTELLASYTRVASGAMWVHTRRGWRRRRFSELDPVRLASLLDVVPEEERPGVYRRLGDLALFLTGVFPDHTELRGLGPIDEGRLLRVSGFAVEEGRPARTVGAATGTVSLLERLGQRWYRLASQTARPLTGSMRVVADVGERFGPARRTLNYLTDRHLFVRRADWFGDPSS
ncbi:MAG: hypothetical protein ACRD0G_00070 [Acidimicrobiales bacterium]